MTLSLCVEGSSGMTVQPLSDLIETGGRFTLDCHYSPSKTPGDGE